MLNITKIKKALIATAVVGAFAAAPVVASANDLVVTDNTSVDSTVLVNGLCVGDTGHFTAAHSSSKTPWALVQTICINFPCSATVFMGNSHNCTGTNIGTVSIDASGNITPNGNGAGGFKMAGGSYSVTVSQ